MKHPHFFVFPVPCLVAVSVMATVPMRSMAQEEPVDSSPAMDPLLRTVLESAPSPDTGGSPVSEVSPSSTIDGATPVPLPESKPSVTPSSTGESVPDSLPVPSLSDRGNALDSPARLSPEPKDSYEGQAGVFPVADSGRSGIFRNGRIGGWAGYVTGSDIEGGYTGRVELDLPILDYPCFISIRGEYLSTDGGDYTETWKDVYGRYGYSYYSYTDKHTDVTDTSYGGTALLLWNPIRNRQVCVYGGIGFACLKTEHGEEVSRVRVDHHSYGRYYWGSYSHRYFRTSRKTSSFHEDESDNNSAMVFRVGSSLYLWDRDILGAEVSYMPDLYDDSSECELRGNYLWKYADNSSLDFVFEYRTEAKTIVGGVGMSVWY